jgi:hypothetical protein
MSGEYSEASYPNQIIEEVLLLFEFPVVSVAVDWSSFCHQRMPCGTINPRVWCFKSFLASTILKIYLKSFFAILTGSFSILLFLDSVPASGEI